MKPPEAATEPRGPGQFRFDKFIVRQIVFNEVERQQPAEGETREASIGVSITINAAVEMNPSAMRSLVTLTVGIAPDPKWQPYNLLVKVSGGFVGENVELEQFDSFCRNGVPAILFPYVREIVHHATRDGLFGVIRIDPINIAELTSKAEWGDVQDAPKGASNVPERP